MGWRNDVAVKGELVHLSFDVPGSSPVDALARMRAVLERLDDVTITNPSVGVLHVARMVRGVGGLRTEACSVNVVREPRRLLVTINGHLPTVLVEELKAAAAGRSVADSVPEVVETFRPAGLDGSSPRGGFTAPSDWFVADEPPAPPRADGWAPPHGPAVALPSPSGPAAIAPFPPPVVAEEADSEAAVTVIRRASTVVMRMGDGRRFDVAPQMLVGRSPVARGTAEAQAVCVVIADPEVSKTHLALGRDHETVWVEDRGSTNGTFVVGDDGSRTSLEAGHRVVFRLPFRLEVGAELLEFDLSV